MLVFILLSSLCASSFACLSSGICGMAGGCGGGYPPPMPSCNPGCGPGYGCGSYGCYRLAARVHSSKTLSIRDQADEMRLSPDQKFHHCCESRQLPDACLAKCSYTTYTKDTIRAMYFKLDSCPSQAGADIHFCAAQGRDHRECCRQNAVSTTLAGDKCLAFCDQRPGRVTQLDFTYLVCYHRFEQMIKCFYDDITMGKGADLPPISLSSIEKSTDEMADYESRDTDFQPSPPRSPKRAKTFRQN